MALVYIGIAVLSYLIGALPIGVLVGDRRGIDLRKHGSGKTGTTNVLRTIGRRAAAMVLVGDFAKGALAVAVSRAIAEAFVSPGARVGWLDDRVSVLTLASAIAAVAVVSGHVWSIYLRILTGRWGGGRGVVPAMGAMFVINFWIGLLALAVGIPTMLISRYVSLASILGAAASGLGIIVLVLLGYMPALSLLFVVVVIFIIAAHRDNIERLLKGTERKLGERAT
jgi:acyl phosphate:glycerol-3-phosphate acyltransferase